MANVLEGFITQHELAEQFGVCPRTVLRWCDQRKIPFIKFGRKRLFDPSAVRDALTSQTVEPVKTKPRR